MTSIRSCLFALLALGAASARAEEGSDPELAPPSLNEQVLRLPGDPDRPVSQAPAHGSAAALPVSGHPVFPAASPLAACNAATAPGMSVVYTPVAGCSGSDALTFEETDVNGGHHVFHSALTVQ